MKSICPDIIERMRNYPKKRVNEHLPIYVSCILETGLKIENVVLKNLYKPTEDFDNYKKGIESHSGSDPYLLNYDENESVNESGLEYSENNIGIDNIVEMSTSRNIMSQEFWDKIDVSDPTFDDEHYQWHIIFAVQMKNKKWFNFHYEPDMSSVDRLLVMPHGYYFSDIKLVHKNFVYLDSGLERITDEHLKKLTFYGQYSGTFFCYVDFDRFVKKYDESLSKNKYSIEMKELGESLSKNSSDENISIWDID